MSGGFGQGTDPALAATAGGSSAGSRHRAVAPYPAMAIFLLPILLLLPVKLVALWFIVRGQAVLGLLVILIAKVIGTAFVTRIFVLCKPSLLALSWFQRLHDRVLAIKERLYAYVRALPLWRAARRWAQTTRALFRGVDTRF